MTRWQLLALAICVPLLAQDATLEHARQVNLERAAKMPNFVADEVVAHYVDRKGAGAWKLNYTVEDEITVKGNQISRRNFLRNGKPWSERARIDLPFTPGIPATGFGAALEPLFDTHCPTTLKFAGDDELRGRAVLAYRFDSPAKGCFGNLYVYRNVPYNAARTGRILIDGPSGDLLRFEEEAFGFPKQFGVVSRHQVMTWDYVRIGQDSYWLPVSAEFIWTRETHDRSKAVVEYRNHRHFESATDIRYQ